MKGGALVRVTKAHVNQKLLRYTEESEVTRSVTETIDALVMVVIRQLTSNRTITRCLVTTNAAVGFVSGAGSFVGE